MIKVKREWDSDPKTETAKPECTQRPISENWDEYDTLFYNAWQGVDIRPTRLEDRKAMIALDIDDYVNNITSQMGLGTMGYIPHTLYPDWACQFLASCRLFYADESAKVA